RRHGRLLDGLEAVAAEEVHLEGQAEHPGELELARPFDERREQGVPHAPPAPRAVDGERAHLGEVGPHDVQRPAADDALARDLGDHELLDGLEVAHELLREEDAVLRVLGDEVADRRDVARQSGADDGRVHQASLAHVQVRAGHAGSAGAREEARWATSSWRSTRGPRAREPSWWITRGRSARRASSSTASTSRAPAGSSTI